MSFVFSYFFSPQCHMLSSDVIQYHCICLPALFCRRVSGGWTAGVISKASGPVRVKFKNQFFLFAIFV